MAALGGGESAGVAKFGYNKCFHRLSAKSRCLPVPALSRIPGPMACVKKTALHSAQGGSD